MKTSDFGEMILRYTAFEWVKLEAGAQSYGLMEGTMTGAVSGTLQLTQLAPNRPDGVTAPVVRGLLRTDDGAVVYVAMDGISVSRPEDGSWAYTNVLTFRTAEERYRWLNTALVIAEGVAKGETARARLTRVEHDLLAATR